MLNWEIARPFAIAAPGSAQFSFARLKVGEFNGLTGSSSASRMAHTIICRCSV
jgi:hypothetical protein